MDKILDQLLNWENDFLIVSVSAASNVTSQVTDLKSLNTVISNF
jgi:selenocysteine lyase/cysteine desulfurase